MPTRILIADDNEILRDRLAELIERHGGWEVCAIVGNGQQAVEKAEELKPDLIVLDLAMPVMNGLQAARKIGQRMPSVPILIYTLHNSSWVELEAKKAGARRVVFKPNVETLLTVIEEFVKKESQELAPEAALAAETIATAGMSELVNETEHPEIPLAGSGQTDTPLS
jgi:CheY-like chemotaxis protein